MAGSLYEMVKGDPFDPIGAMERGLDFSYKQKINQNKLAELARADQARPLIGNALIGDKNSLRSLAGIDPGAYMEVGKFQNESAESEQKIRQKNYEQIRGVLSAAKDQNQWNSAIGFLQSQGMEVPQSFTDFRNRDFVLAQADKDAEEYGLNLIYAQDGQGNLQAFQPSKGGGIKQVTLPNGMSLAPGVKTIDTGTGTMVVDSRAGRPLAGAGGAATGVVPKDIAGKQADEEIGKIQGAAQAALPGARVAADNVKQQIDDVLNDPDLASVTGFNKYRPEFASSNAMIKVRGKLQKLGGQAFLEARTMLKGGGAITDFESKRAEQAFSAIENAVASSDVELLKSELKNFKDAVDTGLAKLEAAANQKSPAANQGGGDYNLGQVFDDSASIPEGATVVDDETGQAMQKINGQLVPVQ